MLSRQLMSWGMRGGAYLLDCKRASLHAMSSSHSSYFTPFSQRILDHHPSFTHNHKTPNAHHYRTHATNDKQNTNNQSSSLDDTANNTTLSQHWQTFLHTLHNQGHFSSDPQVSISSINQDKGALKRAVLSFARQRPDIFHTTLQSRQSLIDLIQHGVPELSDRKTNNAYKRLNATVVKKQSLSVGDGGAADFQDVCRLVLTYMTTQQQHDSNQEAALNDIMSNIIHAMTVPISENVDMTQMSDKAKNMQQLQSKKKD